MGDRDTALFDSHSHLFLMDGSPADAVARARDAGVEGLVCVGIDAESSRRSRELADSLPGVFATAGVHPHTATDFDAAAGSVIEELMADPRVVGVGETGLDHFRRLSPVEDQERAFRAHCALARESGKALVVHTREAWPDVLRILEEERAERVVLHCFSGDAEVAREAAARGYLCSFAGIITYPANARIREAAAVVPPELLLVETDSPFLPPQDLRGSDNSPGNVRQVVEAVAEARHEEASQVRALTAANAKRVFGIPG
ncbi:MAG TPA: TatD family hydrolase [Actinomycetota bacterium]|nr:TatD family hydrolase [Actinomycetota bacterium]